jgi:hypothetical protein
MSKTLAQQLRELFPSNDIPKISVVRSLRHVYSASVGHGYLVRFYVEYSDGSLVFVREGVIGMAETGIRRREVGTTTWEENVGASCPGWFRCDRPKQAPND